MCCKIIIYIFFYSPSPPSSDFLEHDPYNPYDSSDDHLHPDFLSSMQNMQIVRIVNTLSRALALIYVYDKSTFDTGAGISSHTGLESFYQVPIVRQPVRFLISVSTATKCLWYSLTIIYILQVHIQPQVISRNIHNIPSLSTILCGKN